MRDYNALYDWLERFKLTIYIDNFVKGGFDMTSMHGLTAEVTSDYFTPSLDFNSVNLNRKRAEHYFYIINSSTFFTKSWISSDCLTGLIWEGRRGSLSETRWNRTFIAHTRQGVTSHSSINFKKLTKYRGFLEPLSPNWSWKLSRRELKWSLGVAAESCKP